MAEGILHYRENGIEFWTVEATGKSAVSMRGLSRMCGVRIQEVQRYLGLDHKTGNKCLESLDGIELYLTTKIQKNGKDVLPVTSEAAAIVIEHCAFERGKVQARLTLRAFLHIGFESFVQGKTGWLPKAKQSSHQSRSLIDFILSNPKQWTMHFNPQWQREACRVTGYPWHPSRPMAQFISTYIYKALPKEVYEKLLIQNADRKSRHHQFFDDVADELVLKEHIQQVGGLLRVSRNKAHFKQLFNDAYGDGIQGVIEVEGEAV